MPTVDESNLGAWLLKCNPAVYDLRAAVEAGVDHVDSWSVRPGYRARLMTEGHRALLWVSGDGKRMARGIWGLGWVRGPAREVDPDAEEPRYWVDRAGRGAVRMAIPLDIPVLTDPVTVKEVRAAGILDLEVLKIPQGANPSWVSKDQLADLEHLLPPWSAPAGGDPSR